MTLQAQWGLEKTAESAISISRGILQAATSDNVQPLAILACERFGNTLAMCPETCRKVEKTVLPTPPHAVLKFLHSTVGYSAHDCATYFGTSQAGLQFLSFATALMNTMDTLESAKCIHHLLVESETDTSLVPTLMLVEDLMESLEPRCRLSRFTDEILGWHMLLRNLVRDHDEPLSNTVHASPVAPTAEVLKEIVDAFRELSRIGDSGAVKVTFAGFLLAPWLIAFTKWCLGSPPSTYMKDGTPLIETTNSKVRVYLRDALLEVTLEYWIDSPRDLTIRGVPGSGRVFGMVGLRTYCQWLLRRLNVDRGSALAAVQGAIDGALKRAVDNISFVSTYEDSENWDDPLEKSTRRKFPELMLQPLRETSHVLSLMFEEYDTWDNTSDQFSVRKIPAVRTHCEYSPMEPGIVDVHATENDIVKEWGFLKSLAQIVASVLALSLYQHPESLRVFTVAPEASKGPKHLADVIQTALADETKASCPSHLLLDEAMKLVGHFKGRAAADHPVVMSSFSGQTVYFDFLNTNTVFEGGSMSLSWLPGLIWYGADKHHLVQSERLPVGTFDDNASMMTVPVHTPFNSLQGASLKWVVKHDGRRKGLRLALTTDGHKDSPNIWLTGVGGVLSSLLESVILETCPHGKDSCIDGTLAERCRYLVPGRCISGYLSTTHTKDVGRNIYLVAVDGNDALRFYACAHLSGKAAAFRGKACLDCCVEVCIEAGLSFVIL